MNIVTRRIVESYDEWCAVADEKLNRDSKFDLGSAWIRTGDQPIESKELFLSFSESLAAQPEQFFRPANRRATFIIERFKRNSYENIIFESAVSTDSTENNSVHVRLFGNDRKRVLIILPHWNADPAEYYLFARAASFLGVTAAVLTLPYHGQRRRPDDAGASYFVSANIGRTIHAVRQAVIDACDFISHLKSAGYDRIAVVGASLGSCIAGIAAAHDERIDRLLMLLTAGNFADVVWTGRATRHIRQAVEPNMTLPELERAWRVISIEEYADKLVRPGFKALILSGKHDKVVLPDLTQKYLEILQESGTPADHALLSCGHHSMALPPFNVQTLLRCVSFVKA